MMRSGNAVSSHSGLIPSETVYEKRRELKTTDNHLYAFKRKGCPILSTLYEWRDAVVKFPLDNSVCQVKTTCPVESYEWRKCFSTRQSKLFLEIV